MKTRLLRKLTDRACDDYYDWFMENVFVADGNAEVADWAEKFVEKDIWDYSPLEDGEFRAFVMKAMWDADKDSIRAKYSKYTRYSKELSKKLRWAKLREIMLVCWG